MTWDENIVWTTNYGRVGVIDPLFKTASNVLQLPGLAEVEQPNHQVTNSFAVDKSNGIYVVTSLYMCKVIWSKEDNTVKLVWSTKYHDKE